jgi:NAD+ kinase
MLTHQPPAMPPATAINTVGIISKPAVPAAADVVPRLLAWLDTRGIRVRYDERTAVYAGRDDGLRRDDVPEGCDLVIVLGGDGTLLSAARAIGNRQIPLFAVNLGGLGFLTAITIDELYPELERALRGEHRIGRRKLLHAEVRRGDTVVSRYEALNDVVLTKAAIARMIDLDAFVDHQFMCAYKADGLIVSTPDRLDGLFAFRRRADHLPVRAHHLSHAHLPAHAHQPAGAGFGTSVVEVRCRGEDASVYLTIDGQIGEPLKKTIPWCAAVPSTRCT